MIDSDDPRIRTVDFTPRISTDMLPRAPFPIIDCRTREEPGPGDPRLGGQAQFASIGPSQFQFMEKRYAAPLPLKPDPLFCAQDAIAYGYKVWLDDEPVKGTFHFKHIEKADRWNIKKDRLLNSGNFSSIDEPCLIVDGPGRLNYFHWMIEFMPRLAAVEQLIAMEPDLKVVLNSDKLPGFIMDSIRTFYPEVEERFVQNRNDILKARKLYFFTDRRYADNSDYVTRMKTTTQSFLEGLHAEGNHPRSNPSKLLFISRADADVRRLVNEAELVDHLDGFEVRVATFAGMSVSKQAEAIEWADVIVGPHGAGLSNIIFSSERVVVVELTSTQYFKRCPSFADIAMIKGCRYNLIVCDQEGDNWTVCNNIGNDLYLDPSQFPKIEECILKY